MSTQYEFMKRQVVEEVAALQEKLIAIQADCINRIKEIPVTSDLEDTMDELLNKISNQFLFQIEEPESASVVIGTARAGHFFLESREWVSRHFLRRAVAPRQSRVQHL